MVEVMISISILAGVILGLVALSISFFTLSKTNVNETKAAYLLQEGFEAVRKIRDLEWTNISALNANLDYYLVYNETAKTWSLTTSSNEAGGFTRKIRVANALREDTNSNGELDAADPVKPDGTLVDTETKKIVITVSWKDKGNLPRDYTAESYLTNWH